MGRPALGLLSKKAAGLSVDFFGPSQRRRAMQLWLAVAQSIARLAGAAGWSVYVGPEIYRQSYQTCLVITLPKRPKQSSHIEYHVHGRGFQIATTIGCKPEGRRFRQVRQMMYPTR